MRTWEDLVEYLGSEELARMCGVFYKGWSKEAGSAGEAPVVDAKWVESLTAMHKRGATAQDVSRAVAIAWDGAATEPHHRWLRFCRVMWDSVAQVVL